MDYSTIIKSLLTSLCQREDFPSFSPRRIRLSAEAKRVYPPPPEADKSGGLPAYGMAPKATRGAGLWLVEPTAHRGDFLVNVYSIMRRLITQNSKIKNP